MLRSLHILLFTSALLFVLPVHATVYKCHDAESKITYTNLPCDKSGFKESKVIPPAPPPAVPAPTKNKPGKDNPPPEARPDKTLSTPTEKKGETSLQLLKSRESNEKKCARLTEQLGKTMDEMDAARRQGYTPKQETEWNAQLKKLQADKNKLGCL